MYGGGGKPQYNMQGYNSAMDAWAASQKNPQTTGGERGGPAVDQGITQSSGPMPKLDDYLLPGDPNAEGGFNLKYFPGDTIADQSPDTLAAQDMIRQRAMNGSDTMNSAKGLLNQTLNGDFLDISKAPGFQQGLEDIKKAYTTGTAAQTDAAFNRSGAYGGTAYDETKQMQNKAYGDSLNKFGGDMYQAERQKQMQGLLFAPQMANQDYFDAQQLSGLGAQQEDYAQGQINEDINRFNFDQNSPINALQMYQNLISGNYGSTSTGTQPYYSNRGAGMLGGALTGASLGGTYGAGIAGMLGSATPWMFGGPAGMGIGAGIGLLGGLL